MRNPFDRKPGYHAEVFAEAQALADDGLDREFILALFPDDAPWLEGMLFTSEGIEDAIAGESPSYFFEGSLKSKFLAAARTQPAPAPQFGFGGLRTAVATLSVASSAAVVGVLTLGFVTAGDAVPGDWNYTFKLANERVEYTLSRGDGRVEVQLRTTRERVEEIRVLSNRGEASSGDLLSLEREARVLSGLARTQDLDEVQRERLNSLVAESAAVLRTVSQKQPELDTHASAAAAAVNDAVVTALGPAPTRPAATSTPAASTTPTPSPTESSTPGPTATPETPTATPSPTESATPTPTETATPTEPPTPSPTAEATPSAPPSGTAVPTATGTPTTPTP